MISKNFFKSVLIILVLFSFCLISNSQAGWFTQSSGTTEHLESVFFINSMTGWAVGYSGIVLKTTNGGSNWIAYSGGTTNPLLSVYFVNSLQGWAVGGDADIIATGNGGLNWTLQSTGSTSVLNSVHFINASSGWAVGGFMTIVKTTNGGSNWEPLLSGEVILNSVFFTSVNTGFIAGHGGYVMKTTNAGLNWFVQNSNVDYSLYSIHFPPGITTTGYTVGMGTPSPPILKSIDSGLNWTIQPVSSGDALTSVNFVDVSIGWAAGYMGTVMHTSNGGINWSYQLSGTSQSLRSIYFINSNTGWAVGDLGTIIKTTNSGLTAIKPISNIIPERFSLHQNYPNPFNPSTIISFDVPAYSFINIIVYDVQGKEVQTLVNEYLNPGTYEMPFNSSKLASGIYFYIMNSGSFVKSKKMMLLK